MRCSIVTNIARPLIAEQNKISAALDVIEDIYQQHDKKHNTAVSRDKFGHAVLASLKTILALPILALSEKN